MLTRGRPRGGTGLTVEVAKRLEKPRLVVDLTKNVDIAAITDWRTGHIPNVVTLAPLAAAPLVHFAHGAIEAGVVPGLHEMGRSPLGGACVSVTLPEVRCEQEPA